MTSRCRISFVVSCMAQLVSETGLLGDCDAKTLLGENAVQFTHVTTSVHFNKKTLLMANENFVPIAKSVECRDRQQQTRRQFKARAQTHRYCECDFLIP